MNSTSNLAELQVFGRIYLAHEGINAQISVPVPELEEFRIYLESIEPLKGSSFKYGSFRRRKIVLGPENKSPGENCGRRNPRS